MNIKNIVNQIVSISCFNKGQAAKIFDRLKTDKQMVVVKNNNPVAVVMSIEEYQNISEKLSKTEKADKKASYKAPKKYKFSVCEPKKKCIEP